MAITQTTVIAKQPVCPGLSMAVYSLALDNNYVTGGYALDLSDFSKVYGITAGGNDTLADNGYSFAGIGAYGTAPTSSNKKLSVFMNYNPGGAGSADRVHIEAVAAGVKDLSAIGQLIVTVFGK
jgi:hypothetical protein